MLCQRQRYAVFNGISHTTALKCACNWQERAETKSSRLFCLCLRCPFNWTFNLMFTCCGPERDDDVDEARKGHDGRQTHLWSFFTLFFRHKNSERCKITEEWNVKKRANFLWKLRWDHWVTEDKKVSFLSSTSIWNCWAEEMKTKKGEIQVVVSSNRCRWCFCRVSLVLLSLDCVYSSNQHRKDHQKRQQQAKPKLFSPFVLSTLIWSTFL